MNRAYHFNYIEEKLSVLATRIELRGKLNILDLHLHSEDFYLHLLNAIFGWQLTNINVFKSNVEGIDLVDKENKTVLQVSATATTAKIISSLSKDLKKYKGYRFKFVSISKDASDLRKQKFGANPNSLKFTPKEDILDIKLLLNKISSLSIEHQFKVFSLIKKELGKDTDATKIPSNLTTLINILASKNFASNATNASPEAFKIDEKIKYNDLKDAKVVISDYAVNATLVGQIYKEFDKSGANKSSSVLNSIRQIYLKKKNEFSADALFFEVIDQIIDRITKSSNFLSIPLEELEQAVNILVVDSFIRCKIFENPVKGNNATPQ